MSEEKKAQNLTSDLTTTVSEVRLVVLVLLGRERVRMGAADKLPGITVSAGTGGRGR
jgi:hypothetical protein